MAKSSQVRLSISAGPAWKLQRPAGIVGGCRVLVPRLRNDWASKASGNPLFRDKTLICTMMSSTGFCGLPGPYGYKWPTLPELHRALFGSTYVEAHDAGTDVAVCAKCFFELKRRRLVAG